MANLTYKTYRQKALAKDEIQQALEEREEFFALRRDRIRICQEASVTQAMEAQSGTNSVRPESPTLYL